MTRTTQRKILQIVFLVAVIGADRMLFAKGGAFQVAPLWRIAMVLSLPLFLALPHLAMRKVYKSHKLNRRGQFEAAKVLAREGIEDLLAHPWKIRLEKLTLDAYSSEPVATAYICLGVAQRGLGELDDAAASFSTAVSLDPLCPTAHVGLAGVAFDLGDEVKAERMLQRAADLGYSGSLSDRLFTMGGEMTARLVGALSGKRKN